MSSGGPNGGGGWQHDLQHLWTTLLGQLPSTTQPLLKAVRLLRSTRLVALPQQVCMHDCPAKQYQMNSKFQSTS